MNHTIKNYLTRTCRSTGVLMALISGLISIQTMAQSSVQATAAQASATAQPLKKGYAHVNGLKMYYEIYGNGEPTHLEGWNIEERHQ